MRLVDGDIESDCKLYYDLSYVFMYLCIISCIYAYVNQTNNKSLKTALCEDITGKPGKFFFQLDR